MKTDYHKQGKLNRKSGREFELKVRKDLEAKGWIVAKWTNNLEPIETESEGFVPKELQNKETVAFKMIPAKHKFNPFRGAMAMGTGFCDFICYRLMRGMQEITGSYDEIHGRTSCTRVFDLRQYGWYEVIGVEVKSNGTLSREEKLKCQWLLKNNIFSKILIARQGRKKGEDRKDIIYEEFQSSIFAGGIRVR